MFHLFDPPPPFLSPSFTAQVRPYSLCTVLSLLSLLSLLLYLWSLHPLLSLSPFSWLTTNPSAHIFPFLQFCLSGVHDKSSSH